MTDLVERVAQAIRGAYAPNATDWRQYVAASRAAISALIASWEPTDAMVAQAVELMRSTPVTMKETGVRTNLGHIVPDEGELSALFRSAWRGAMYAALNHGG